MGGPEPLGVRKANLSAEAMTYMEEVALNEQVSSILMGSSTVVLKLWVLLLLHTAPVRN